MTIQSDPPLPPEIAAKLEAILRLRPASSAICQACWVKQFLGSEWTPLTCACRREPSTGIEARLRRQQEGEPSDAAVAGDCDALALAKLRERAMKPIRRHSADGESQ